MTVNKVVSWDGGSGNRLQGKVRQILGDHVVVNSGGVSYIVNKQVLSMIPIKKEAAAKETPRFAETCLGNMFLGRHGRYDLYFCPQGGDPTVIARFEDGSVGKYYSGLRSADQIEPLAEAKKRAIERGLLPRAKPDALVS